MPSDLGFDGFDGALLFVGADFVVGLVDLGGEGADFLAYVVSGFGVAGDLLFFLAPVFWR